MKEPFLKEETRTQPDLSQNSVFSQPTTTKSPIKSQVQKTPKSFNEKKIDSILPDGDKDDESILVDEGAVLSSLPETTTTGFDFKPVSTWASSAGRAERNHPWKKPAEKQVRSAVATKKVGKTKPARMKPQHADDDSVVKIKKSNRKNGEVTYTKKFRH